MADKVMIRRPVEIVANSIERLSQDVSPSQFCRTCSRQDSRVTVSLAELKAAREAGIPLEDLKCQPDKIAGIRRIHQDRTTSDEAMDIGPIQRSESTDDDGAVRVQITRKPEKVIVGSYDTCGQEILDKCLNCARFNRQTIRVPAGINAYGRTYYTEVLVGGNCKIPEEGLLIGGHRVFCDKKPLSRDPLDQVRNCSTCRYNITFSTDSMLDHVSPLYYELTSYEFDMARDRAADPSEVGLEIYYARQAKAKVPAVVGPNTKARTLTWIGIYKFYRLRVERVYENEQGSPVAVDLRMPSTGAIYNFDLHNSDERVGLIDLVDGRTAVLQILSPYHRQYGLTDNDRFSYPQAPQGTCRHCNGNGVKEELQAGVFKLVECSACRGAGTVTSVLEAETLVKRDLADRVNELCKICNDKTGTPCLHHARASVQSEQTIIIRLPDDTIHTTRGLTDDYTDPGVSQFTTVTPESRKLHLQRDPEIKVLDGNGMEPDFFLFRIWYRSILEWCKTTEETRAVMAQYGRAKEAVERFSRVREADLGWNRPAPGDPWHPICAVNLYDKSYRPGKITRPDVSIFTEDGVEIDQEARGIDFSRAWNDTFGTPRSDMSTNPVFESRFGVITGIGGAIITRGMRLDEKFAWPKYQENEDWIRRNADGEIVQDEFLASEHHLVQGRRGRGGGEWTGMPKRTKTRKLGVGVPNTAIQFKSTEEARNWLDAPAEMPGNDEAEGFVATNRWFSQGYEFFRNTKKLLADDIPSVFEFRLTAHSESDEFPEGNAFFVCSTCYDPRTDKGRYSPEEVSVEDLTCPDPNCDGVLIFMTAAGEEWRQGHMQVQASQIDTDEPYRRRSGAPDTTSWQTTERLMNMVCECWTPRFGRRSNA